MAESYYFGKDGLDGAKEVFPDLPWRHSTLRGAFVFDAKADEYVPVNEGDYIVRIGDRYEVTNKKPREAKKATASNDSESDDSKKSEADDAPKGDDDDKA